MEQFTLFENQNPDSQRTYPYFVDVQNNLLNALNTRMVIPLVAAESVGKTITKLCPVTDLHGNSFALMTQQMTNVSVSALKVPIGSLAHMRDEIVAAIDLLITGI